MTCHWKESNGPWSLSRVAVLNLFPYICLLSSSWTLHWMSLHFTIRDIHSRMAIGKQKPNAIWYQQCHSSTTSISDGWPVFQMLASPCSFGPNRGSCVQSTAPTSILPGPIQFFFLCETFDIRNHIVFFRLPSQALRASLPFMNRLGLVDIIRRPSESGRTFVPLPGSD